MVLTQEQRIELLARARAAKANKKLEATPVVNVEPPVEQPPTPKVKKSRKKNEVVPLPEPVQVIQESEEEDEPESESLPEPVPVPKKKALPVKWLKKPPEVQKCCDEKVSKEEPLISDEKPEVVKHIVIPATKEVKKARVPRASSRTLEIVAEPKAIEDVLDEVKNNDMKYRPQQKKQAPPPSAPIQIIKTEVGLRLFDY